MITQAIILAGGLGTRLGKLTQETPKPLLAVAGKPFLEHLVNKLKSCNVTEVILSVGYLAEKIIEYFSDGKDFGISIDYVIEKKPAGTGGGVLLAKQQLKENFFVLNGDTYFDVDLLDLASFHEHTNATVTMALRHLYDTERFGTVVLDRGYITGFAEKEKAGAGLINGGIYAMQRSVVEYFPGKPFISLEKDIFPCITEKRLLAAKEYDSFFIDIGLPETLKQANELLKC